MAKRRFIIDFDEETNKKKIVVGDVLLLVVFGALIALVVTLMLTAKKEKDNPSNVFADLIVPIVEENSKNEFLVDLSAIDNKEYTIKVTNYHGDDDINKKELNYDLEIINEEDVPIALYKNEIKDNLISSNNEVLVEKNNLKSKEKQEDVYRIVVKTDKKLSDKDTIKVLITS